MVRTFWRLENFVICIEISIRDILLFRPLDEPVQDEYLLLEN